MQSELTKKEEIAALIFVNFLNSQKVFTNGENEMALKSFAQKSCKYADILISEFEAEKG